MLPTQPLPPYSLPFALNHDFPIYPMDLAAVDFRAFYPYTPNEVKHRKRTTSRQLKTLEDVFKRDTKPNAALRNELATSLDMTPRGVQVWFQNRRAKEKTKATKLATKVGSSTREQPAQSQSPSPRPSLADGTTNSTESPGSHPETLPVDAGSPHTASPPQLHLNTDSSANNSWQSSPVATPDDIGFHDATSDLHSQRRGSIPIDLTDPSATPPLLGHMDPFVRRCSVDASLSKLAYNPYAPLARAKNCTFPPARISGRLHNRPSYSTRGPAGPQPSMQPQRQTQHTRHSSMDALGFRFAPTNIPTSPSPSPLSYSVRASLPDNTLYAFSSRQIVEPIPGPLPSPGFSFGAANTSTIPSPNSEKSSPELHGFYDPEDDLSTSYDAYSRFGSIASVGTADSSNTSAYYSDVGDLGIVGRRDSCSGHFLGLMSNLDVNGIADNSYRHTEDSVIGPPARLVAGDSSNGLIEESTTVAFTQTSELAFALQKSEPLDGSNSTLAFGHHSDPPNDNGYFFYSDGTPVHSEVDLATSDNSALFQGPRYTDGHYPSANGITGPPMYPRYNITPDSSSSESSLPPPGEFPPQYT